MFSDSCNDRHRRIGDRVAANHNNAAEMRVNDNATGVNDNAAWISNNSAEISDNATGIGYITEKVIPC